MQSHRTVLEREAVEGLALTESSVVVDATIGSGGHARAIANKLGAHGRLIGIDIDEHAVEALRDTLSGSTCAVQLVVGNFKDIDSILEQQHVKEVDAILADLGWRTEQFSGNGKGFSFRIDEPLIMTFGDPQNYPFVAKDIVNEWEAEDLRNVLKGYGEERYARRIAEAIIDRRRQKPINTTYELVEIVKEATPPSYHRKRIHPATRTFQALRIAVNDELGALEQFIQKSVAQLQHQGRLAIISFHSLEDRIVKHLYKNLAAEQRGTVITKKPITPSDAEIQANPRSRSAKLRIFEKN